MVFHPDQRIVPQHGRVSSITLDGTFTYIPDPGFVGSDTFTYKAGDAGGGGTLLSQGTVTINVTDQAPVANDDGPYSTQEATFFRRSALVEDAAHGVLANDTDPDNDRLIAIIKTPTTHGSLSLEADGSFTYTPNTGFLGTDSFAYYASDDLKQTLATATIQVNPLTLSGKVVDGYVSGSTVFADTNDNDLLDASEVSTTTDSGGNFLLTGGSGPLVMSGGTDIATKLPFQGHLNAPEGSAVITPLTTVVVTLWSRGVPDPIGAVLTAFHLDAAIDLLGLDPIAGTSGGDAQAALAYSKGVEVFDTLTLIGSVLGGSDPGQYAAAYDAVLAGMAELIVAHGAGTDLTDHSQLSELIQNAQTIGGYSLDSSLSGDVSAIVSAVNQAVENTGATGVQLLSALSAIALVAQGAASDGLKQVADGTNDISSAATQFTGTQLANAIDAARTHTGDVDGPAIENAPVANTDSYQALHNAVIQDAAHGVLVNDTDADGDPLKAALVSGPAHGSLAYLNADGSFSYTAGSNYSGDDSFTYALTDGILTTQATVTIHGIDTAAPVITLAAGDNQTDEATGPNGAVATFSATAADTVDGTDPVVFREGGTTVRSGQTFGLGTHTIMATATDAAGNTASQTFTIKVQDTTPPSLTPVSNQTDEATAPNGATATFSATARDIVDGTESVAFKEGNTVVHSGDIFNLGIHTLTASATDAAGNKSSETFTITVRDTTPPDTSIVTGPPTQTSSSTAAFSVKGADAVGVVGFRYALDNAASWSSTTSTSISFNGLAAGAHTFRVAAFDAAGNVDPTPASYAWTVQSRPTVLSLNELLGRFPARQRGGDHADFERSGYGDRRDADTGAQRRRCRNL
jgi:VCBS repeat-containing protein